MALLTIGTTAITFLKGYTVKWYDLSKNSNRNANGDMILRVVNDKREIVLATPYLTETDVQTLFGVLSSGSLSVTFYDPFTNSTLTRNFYRGDRSISLYWDKDTMLFEPMELSLIEL